MIEGSCLCGSVRYQAEQAAGPLAYCHCRMCRKAHGTAFSAILPVEKNGFSWVDGTELLTSFESSHLMQYCLKCKMDLGGHAVAT